MVDICAGRVAYQHSHSRVATLMFDSVRMLRPALHNDIVRVEGELLRTGQSSMVVEVKAFRRDFSTKEWQPLLICHVVMVAIDKQGRPWKFVPKLLEQTATTSQTQTRPPVPSGLSCYFPGTP